MSEPALALHGLTRRYGERLALDRVSVELAEGETLAVFGANGAGKSTLLRVLATLLRPHEGTVEVLGATLPRDSWKVRGRIGFLGHEPLLHRELTPRESLSFHTRLHASPTGRIDALLERVGLADRADETLRGFSRGMVQRAAICRAVLHDPELLLLDEPYANLDPAGVATVAPLVGRESGRTRVLISHDVEAGLAGADLVLGLRDGRVALLARAADLGPARVRELYA